MRLSYNSGVYTLKQNDINKNFELRIKYHNKYFNTPGCIIGSSGISSCIMAYDAFVDCNGHWETLVFYSTLHEGDNDTVGAIAGAWYGAFYGLRKVPKSNYK